MAPQTPPSAGRAPFWGHPDPVNAVAVTPDGQQIISGSDDRTVRIWDRQNGTEQTVLTGHTGPVWAVAVTPDGSEIVSVGDQTIRIWDRRSGRQVRGTGIPAVPPIGRRTRGDLQR